MDLNQDCITPVAGGNYGNLASTKGKIIYLKYPNTGLPNDTKPTLTIMILTNVKRKKFLMR